MAGVQYKINIQADASAAQRQVEQLSSSLQRLQQNSRLNLKIDTNMADAAQQAAKLQQALQQAVNVNTGQINFSALSNSLASANTNVQTLIASFQRAGTTGQQAISQLSSVLTQATIPAQKATGLIAQFGTTLMNTVKWQAASQMVHGLQSAMSGAVSYIENLNTSLNNIRVVTGKSISDMSNFAKEANVMAKSLSTSTKAYADAALIYYQQGDNDRDVQKKAQITLRAANTAFKANAAEMSEMLTAVWNSYKAGGDQLEGYVDVMAKLGSTTATSMEEIATALQKVAATASTVGVGMEQMSSIVATVSSVTRESAESIGTSFKTILARMGDLKLGETLEDGVNLGKVSSSLNSIGVQVLDATGNMRDMGDVITDLGNKWQTMGSAQKTAIAQVVAGKRQYTQLMALFENWDTYQKDLQNAQNSAGSLEKMQKIYEDSVKASKQRVQASKEAIFGDLINDQAIVKFNNVLTGVLSVVRGIVDGFGGIPGILAKISSMMMTAFRPQLLDKFTSGFMAVGGLFGKSGSIATHVNTLRGKNGPNLIGRVPTYQKYDKYMNTHTGYNRQAPVVDQYGSLRFSQGTQQRALFDNLTTLRRDRVAAGNNYNDQIYNNPAKGGQSQQHFNGSTTDFVARLNRDASYAQSDSALAKQDLMLRQNRISSQAMARRQANIDFLNEKQLTMSTHATNLANLQQTARENLTIGELAELEGARNAREFRTQAQTTAATRAAEARQAWIDNQFLPINERQSGEQLLAQQRKAEQWSQAFQRDPTQAMQNLTAQVQEEGRQNALKTNFKNMVTDAQRSGNYEQLAGVLNDEENPVTSAVTQVMQSLTGDSAEALSQMKAGDIVDTDKLNKAFQDILSSTLLDTSDEAYDTMSEIVGGDAANRARRYGREQGNEETIATIDAVRQQQAGADNDKAEKAAKLASGFEKVAQGAMAAVEGITSVQGAMQALNSGDTVAGVTSLVSAGASLAQTFATQGPIIGGIQAATMIITGIFTHAAQEREKLEQQMVKRAETTNKILEEHQQASQELMTNSNAFDSLNKQFEDGALSVQEYSSALADIASSLGIQGAAVMALTGNYQGLTAAIQESIEAAREQQIETAESDVRRAEHNIENQAVKIAKENMGDKYRAKKGNEGNTDVTTGVVYNDILGSFNTNMKQSGLLTSLQNSSIRQMLAEQYGIKIDSKIARDARYGGDGEKNDLIQAFLSGGNTKAGGYGTFRTADDLIIDADLDTLLGYYNQLSAIKEAAKTIEDPGMKSQLEALVHDQSFEDIDYMITEMISPYLNAVKSMRELKGQDWLKQQNVEGWSSDVQESLVEGLLADWDIDSSKNDAITRAAKKQAGQLVTTYARGLVGVSESDIAAADATVANKESAVTAMTTRNKKMTKEEAQKKLEQWGFTDKDWSYMTNIAPFLNNNGDLMDKRVPQLLQQQAKAQTATGLLTQWGNRYSGEFDIDSFAAQLPIVSDLLGLGDIFNTQEWDKMSSSEKAAQMATLMEQISTGYDNWWQQYEDGMVDLNTIITDSQNAFMQERMGVEDVDQAKQQWEHQRTFQRFLSENIDENGKLLNNEDTRNTMLAMFGDKYATAGSASDILRTYMNDWGISYKGTVNNNSDFRGLLTSLSDEEAEYTNITTALQTATKFIETASGKSQQLEWLSGAELDPTKWKDTELAMNQLLLGLNQADTPSFEEWLGMSDLDRQAYQLEQLKKTLQDLRELRGEEGYDETKTQILASQIATKEREYNESLMSGVQMRAQSKKEDDQIKIQAANQAISLISSNLQDIDNMSFDSITQLEQSLLKAGVQAQRVKEIIEQITGADNSKDEIKAGMVAATEAALAELTVLQTQKQEVAGLMTSVDTSQVSPVVIEGEVGSVDTDNMQKEVAEVPLTNDTTTVSMGQETLTSDVSSIQLVNDTAIVTMSDGTQLQTDVSNLTLTNDSVVVHTEGGDLVADVSALQLNNDSVIVSAANGGSALVSEISDLSLTNDKLTITTSSGAKIQEDISSLSLQNDKLVITTTSGTTIATNVASWNLKNDKLVITTTSGQQIEQDIASLNLKNNKLVITTNSGTQITTDVAAWNLTNDQLVITTASEGTITENVKGWSLTNDTLVITTASEGTITDDVKGWNLTNDTLAITTNSEGTVKTTVEGWEFTNGKLTIKTNGKGTVQTEVEGWTFTNGKLTIKTNGKGTVQNEVEAWEFTNGKLTIKTNGKGTVQTEVEAWEFTNNKLIVKTSGKGTAEGEISLWSFENGQLVVTTSDNGTAALGQVQKWEFSNEKLTFTLSDGTPVALDNTVKGWTFTNGKLTFNPASNAATTLQEALNKMSFSVDVQIKTKVGQQLLSKSLQDSIKDLTTEQQQAAMKMLSYSNEDFAKEMSKQTREGMLWWASDNVVWDKSKQFLMKSLVSSMSDLSVADVQSQMSTDGSLLQVVFSALANAIHSKNAETSKLGLFLLQGLADGLQASKDAVDWSGVLGSMGLAEDIISAFCAALGIASPSKLTKALAPFLIQGLQVGLTESISSWQPNVSGLGSKVASAILAELQAAAQQIQNGNTLKDVLDELVTPGFESQYQTLYDYADFYETKQQADEENGIDTTGKNYWEEYKEYVGNQAKEKIIKELEQEATQLAEAEAEEKYGDLDSAQRIREVAQNTQKHLDRLIREHQKELQEAYTNAINHTTEAFDAETTELLNKQEDEYWKNKKYASKESTLNDSEKAYLDEAVKAALNEMGVDNIDEALATDELRDKFYDAIQKHLDIAGNDITSSMESLWSQLQDIWISGLQQIYQNEEATAKQILALWEETFNAIVEMRSKLLEGQSIMEAMFGDEEQLTRYVQSLIQAGKDLDEIKRHLTTPDETPNFEPWDFNTYNNAGRQRFLNNDGNGHYTQTTREEYNENVRNYVKTTLLPELTDVIGKSITQKDVDQSLLDQMSTDKQRAANATAKLAALRQHGLIDENNKVIAEITDIAEIQGQLFDKLVKPFLFTEDQEADFQALMAEAFVHSETQPYKLANAAKTEAEKVIGAQADKLTLLQQAQTELLKNGTISNMKETDQQAVVQILQDLGLLGEEADAESVSMSVLQDATLLLASVMATAAAQIAAAMKQLQNGEADNYTIDSKTGEVTLTKAPMTYAQYEQALKEGKVSEAAQQQVQDARTQGELAYAKQYEGQTKPVDYMEQMAAAGQAAVEEALQALVVPLGDERVDDATLGKIITEAEQQALQAQADNLKAYADALGIVNSEMENYVESIAAYEGVTLEWNDLTNAGKLLMADAAVEYNKAAEALQTLGDAAKENGLFDKMADTENPMQVKEMIQAYQDLAGAVNNFFKDAEVGIDFVKENMDLIKEWANGSVAAMEQLESKIHDMILAKHELDYEKLGISQEQMNTWADGLKYGEQLNAEQLEFIQGVYEAAKAAGKTDAEARKIVDDLADVSGVTLDWNEAIEDIPHSLEEVEKTVREIGKGEKTIKQQARDIAKLMATEVSSFKDYNKAATAAQGKTEAIRDAWQAAIDSGADASELWNEVTSNINPEALEIQVEADTGDAESQIATLTGQEAIAFIQFLADTGMIDGLTWDENGVVHYTAESNIQMEQIEADGEVSGESDDTMSVTITDPLTGKSHTGVGTSTMTTAGQTKATFLAPQGTGGPSGGTGNRPGGGAPKQGNKGGGGGGGGGGKKKKGKSKAELPRYHEVDQGIKRYDSKLSQIGKKEEMAFGATRVKLMREELEKMNKQMDLYQEKLNEAAAYAAKDRANVEGLGAQLGITVQFDENGTIANWEALQEKMIDWYNAHKDDEAKDGMEGPDDVYQRMQKVVEDYEDSLEQLEDMQDKILEQQHQISEKTADTVEEAHNWKIELEDIELELLEGQLERMSETLSTIGTRAGIMVEALFGPDYKNLDGVTFAKLNEEMTKLNELSAEYMAGNIDGATLAERAQEIISTLNDDMSDIYDRGTEIEGLFEEMWSNYNDELSKNTSLIENNISALQTLQEVTDLIGAHTNFAENRKNLTEQYNQSLKLANIQRMAYETMNDQLQQMKDRIIALGATIAGPGSEWQKGWDALDEQQRKDYQSLLSQLQDAQNSLYESLTQAADIAKQRWEADVEEMRTVLDQALAMGDSSLDYLQQAYDRSVEVQDRYLNTAHELYNVNKLNRQIEQAMADTTDKSLRDQFEQLQNVINAKSKAGQLTEYDANMMQKQYELLEKQAALRDAQNAKDTVRLTRDENGNYMYQYTADQDQVDKAVQEYNDVLIEINELSTERVSELEQAILEKRKWYVEQASNIAHDEVLTEEEKQQRLTALREQAAEDDIYFQEQMGTAYENLQINNEACVTAFGSAVDAAYNDPTEGINPTIRTAIDLQDSMATHLGDAIGDESAGLIHQLYELRDALDESLYSTGLMSPVDFYASIAEYTDFATANTADLNEQLEDEAAKVDAVTEAWYRQKEAIESLFRTIQNLNSENLELLYRIGNTIGNIATPTSTGLLDYTLVPIQSNVVGYTDGTVPGSSSSGTSGNNKTRSLTDGSLSANIRAKMLAAGYKFASGGLVDYTGPAWVDGTPDKPELMLNAADTPNLLNTIDMLHSIDTSSVQNLLGFIGGLAAAMSSGGVSASGANIFSGLGGLEQNVHISAEFPNATDKNEILAAFDELNNRASQYINQNR